MLFDTPTLEDEEAVIELIVALQDRLRSQVAEPRRWVGGLHRLTFARAVQGSNSIEGYDAQLDDVVAAMEDDEAIDAATETRRALEGYRSAMTYVLQLALEDHFDVDESTIRSLHFMMLQHELAKSPGRYRPGSIYVRRDSDGAVVYEGPEADLVPGLMGELVDALREPGPPMVRAAMAHLNLVLIHPFRDGNGRMARCLQTLVLASERVLSPVFNSIEEHLGRNTQAYYDVLAEVGRGSWQPDGDARPWLRFCLTAHHQQATTLLRRIEETERLWDATSDLVRERRVAERAVPALMDAAQGLRLRNATYRSAYRCTEGEDLSEQTASRDLKALVAADLLTPKGDKRGRTYSAGPDLQAARDRIRAARRPRSDDDPFELVKR